MDARSCTAALFLSLATLLGGACGGNAGGSDSGGDPPGPPTPGADATYGDAHAGYFWLGPVDFAETKFHNACAPEHGYVSALRPATGLGGEYLAGLSNQYAGAGATCDACILIKATNGKSVVARLVTYGVEDAPTNIDVSPAVVAALAEPYPTTMTWQLAKCPDTGALAFEFKSASSQWWVGLWVRNPRVPVATVEVKSAKHPQFTALVRESDGSLVDQVGFGPGAFTLRVTAVDHQQITQTFPAIPAGQVSWSNQQFQ